MTSSVPSVAQKKYVVRGVGPSSSVQPNQLMAAMAIEAPATTRVAFAGVLKVRCVWPSQRGATPSRPIAYTVRVDAVAQATHTMKADNIAPISVSVPTQCATYVSAIVFRGSASLASLFTPIPTAIEYVVQR